MKILIHVLSFLGIIFRNFNLKNFVNDFVEPAITIVDLIKSAVDNRKLDILVEFTKTDLDDKIKKRASDILSKAINRLVDVREWTEDKPLTEEETINLFIAWIRTQQKPVQSALYCKMASIIASNQSGRAAKEFEIDTIVAMKYAMKKKDELEETKA